MSQNSKLSYGKLLKSALISLLWASASLALALHLKWDPVQVAKAFYVLVIYTTVCLIFQLIIWHYIRDPIQDCETDDFVFSWHTPFPKNWEFILFPIIFIFFTMRELLEAISSRTEGWNVEYDVSSLPFSEFVDVSLENWWLVFVIFGASTWKFFNNLRLVKSTQVRLHKFRERIIIKVSISLLGYLILLGFVIGTFDTNNQAHLYIFLILMFFFPWDAAFEIIMKTYDDYWKLH